MTLDINITINLENHDEGELPEAVAVQRLQDALAAVARETPDELAEIWRIAVKEFARNNPPVRRRHDHGPRRRS